MNDMKWPRFNYVHADVTASSRGFNSIKLFFAVAVPDDEPIPQVVVCMSPEHAKQVSALLSGVVAEYEADHGPIREKDTP